MITWTSRAIATPITFDVEGATDSYVKLSNVSTGILGIGANTFISADIANPGSLTDFTLNDNQQYIVGFFTFSVSGRG